MDKGFEVYFLDGHVEIIEGDSCQETSNGGLKIYDKGKLFVWFNGTIWRSLIVHYGLQRTNHYFICDGFNVFFGSGCEYGYFPGDSIKESVGGSLGIFYNGNLLYSFNKNYWKRVVSVHWLDDVKMYIKLHESVKAVNVLRTRTGCTIKKAKELCDVLRTQI